MNDSVPGGTLVTPVGPPTDEGPDAQEYLEILRRRWRWPVIAVAVAVAATAWIQLRRPELYTAEVLLQREAPRSPLDALNVGVPPGPPPEAIASQIEVLRSRSVLAAVVDSLGLRLRPEKRDAVRSRILAGVRVEPGAPPGRYLLGAEHGRAVLRDAAAGAVLARPGPDGWLEARGLRLLPAADAALDPPVPLAVVPQEAAIRALRRALTVRQVRGTPLARVAHSSPDPVLAAATANAIAASYQAYAAARARAAATRRREFIAGQLAKIADSLAAAQQLLLDYQAESRTLDPRIEGNALATALMDAQAEVRTLRFQEGLLRSLLLSLRSPSADAQAFQRVVALGGDLLPGGSNLYARLQELEAERTRLTAPRYGVTAADPRVEQLDSLIAATRADVRALADQALSVLRARLEAAEDRVRDLQAQVGELPVRATGFRLRGPGPLAGITGGVGRWPGHFGLHPRSAEARGLPLPSRDTDRGGDGAVQGRADLTLENPRKPDRRDRERSRNQAVRSSSGSRRVAAAARIRRELCGSVHWHTGPGARASDSPACRREGSCDGTAERALPASRRGSREGAAPRDRRSGPARQRAFHGPAAARTGPMPD